MNEVEVKGLRELMRALEQLPKEIQGKPTMTALRAAAKPMREDARAKVPQDTGTVLKNIVVARSKVHNGKNFVWGVVLRVKKMTRRQRQAAAAGGNPLAGDPFYWKFLEFGTSKLPARPFLRPAFEGNKTGAVDIIKNRMAKAIEAAARKLNRGPR